MVDVNKIYGNFMQMFPTKYFDDWFVDRNVKTQNMNLNELKNKTVNVMDEMRSVM